MSNSIGSDAFALVWSGDKLHGLNGSGPAPMLADVSDIKGQGFEAIPEYGMIPMTVPGAVASWAALSDRFGRLPFEKLFEPAHRVRQRRIPRFTGDRIYVE